MSYKNPEDRHKHYLLNRERILARQAGYYSRLSPAARKKKTEYNATHKAKNDERERLRYANMRVRVLGVYGNKCACCGEAEPLFLELDHVLNDGNSHRKNIGSGSLSLVRWVIENDYPKSIQLLCSNCNKGKVRNDGVCPHMNGQGGVHVV